MGEYGAAGALIQETVWLEDTPVATLRPKAGGGIDIFYVWADHLDTPRAITASTPANTLMWKWVSDPFGTTAPQESGLAYNLRFPGQYFDVETATHYNYFRDYNPSTGRYQQRDPIGLDDGPNTYAYVANTPLKYIDRRGEARLKYPDPGRPHPGNTGGTFHPGKGSGHYKDYGDLGRGWKDKYGNCWAPTGHKGDHGGPHYDVQKADGSGWYKNVGDKGPWGGTRKWKNFPKP